MNAQAMMGEASAWFQANGLQQNTSKTEVIRFTASRTGDCGAASVRLLGITLDTRLTWKNHTEALSKKLSSAIYAIIRIRQVVGLRGALTAYHALFHSRMSYGLRLWGASCHAITIFKLQKRAIRAIEQVSPMTHCRPLFQKLHILTVTGAYLLQQLCRAREELPALPRRKNLTQRVLRNAEHVGIPHHRIRTTESQHIHHHLLNMLPPSWIEKPITVLKQLLISLFIKESFYDIAEFENFMRKERWKLPP